MGRVLGLDLGSKTIGIACSDLLKIVASGVETYRFAENDVEDALKHVLQVAKERDVEKFVLGLPKHMNGDIGERAQICLDFKDKLEEASGLQVIMIDERWTTKQAERGLLQADMSRKKRKQVIDKMAAVIILQTYLDRL